MMQSIHATHKITINIECFEDVPKESQYCAWITEPEYKGITETGSSIADCVKEIAHSLHVLELYRKNLKNEISNKK